MKPGTNGIVNSILVALFLVMIMPTIAADDIRPISGFSRQASIDQHQLETRLDEKIKAEELDEWLKHMSAKPHHAGSAASKETAEYIAQLMSSWGYQVKIEEFEVLLPTPRVRELQMVYPENFTATLREDSLPEDLSTSVRENLLEPYNAFSAEGDVEAELVFINYGRPEDHEYLERHGIDLTGKIAITRYGKTWRGIKPKLAAEKGAIATIIYSDPADDGYGKGDVYPRGAFKHESAVQRGSVMDMPTYPGDVLTPGIGALKNARRLKIKDAATITKIPVLPISQRDALPLLSAMDGAVVPPEWRGALPITYHLGPGPAKVRLKLAFNWDMVTIYNVIATLKGSKFPNEWVIRGNHHDGWNHGASDPLSGQIAMLAEAKAVAELAAAGFPPARTLVYASWDAEEPGLIGSTEWAELHAKELKKKAVAYINTDGSSRGFLSIGGSHTLENFFNEISADVIDPQTGGSLKQRQRANLKLNGIDEATKLEARERENIRIAPLGSGSDYTPFLQHLGIASANLAFSGHGEGGSYHTLYDTYEHFTTWRDPGLQYCVTLAKVAGRATLRLANAEILPFEFVALHDNVNKYIIELEKLADTMRVDTESKNRDITDGTYTLVLDPRKSLGPPKLEKTVPFINFAPLKNAALHLEQAAKIFATSSTLNNRTEKQTRTINRLLYTSERLLTLDAGLPGRDWYKHHIYAPGFYTGYGVKTLPGVRENIEQRNFDAVPDEIEKAAKILHQLAARIEELNEI